MVMRNAFVMVVVLAVSGCHLFVDIVPCDTDADCDGNEICDTALGVCAAAPVEPPPDDENPTTPPPNVPNEGEGEGEGEDEEVVVVGEGEGEGEGEGGSTIVPLAFACGDGVVSSGETCDDNNRLSGDGCSATCQPDRNLNEVEPNDFPDENGVRDLSVESLVLRGELETFTDSVGNVFTEYDAQFLEVTQPTVLRIESFDRNDADDCAGPHRPAIELWTEAAPDDGFLRGAYDNGACSVLTILAPPANYLVLTYEGTFQFEIPNYRLQLTPLADRGAEQEPNDSVGRAEVRLLSGLDLAGSGTVESATDIDVYAVSVPSGRGLRAEVIPADVDTDCDNFNTQIALMDPLNGQLSNARTGIFGACPFVDGTGEQAPNIAAKNLTTQSTIMYVAVSAGFAAFGGPLPYRIAVTVR